MQEIKKGKNCFYIGEKEKSPLGVIEYRPEGEVYLVTSTRVKPELRGHGVAAKLLDRLADHAREEGVKLLAQCSYVVDKFANDRSYDDIKAEK